MQITPEKVLIQVFENALVERKRLFHRYEQKFSAAENGVAEQIKNDGFAIVRGFAPAEQVKKIKTEMDGFIAKQENLLIPRRLLGFDTHRHYSEAPKLTAEEIQKGESYWRSAVSNIRIREPLLVSHNLFKLAFSDFLVNVTNAYLGALPALGYIKWLRNYANDLPDFDTQNFHIDEMAAKIIKVFLYLNDVDEEGGPFCYVRGSLANRSKYWGLKDRWSDEEIAEMYGKENIISLCAKAGDIVLADTTGFHKGLKPKKTDRNILIFNYGLHREYTYGGQLDEKLKIRRSDFEKLTLRQRAVADELEIVPD